MHSFCTLHLHSDLPHVLLTTHPWWRRWFGSRSERAASRFLRKLGYRILAHNFTCDLGEIDIIALDASCVVFVEVRSTEASDTRLAAESVDARKTAKAHSPRAVLSSSEAIDGMLGSI